LLEKQWTRGVGGTGFDALQLCRLARKNFEGLIICAEAIKLASPSLNGLDRNFNKKKQTRSSSYESSETRSDTSKQFTLQEGSKHLPSSGVLRTHLQAESVGATTFALLALNGLNQKFKEKGRRIVFRCVIVYLIRPAEYRRLTDRFLDQIWTTGVEATGYDSLQLDHSSRKNLKYLMISFEAINLASLPLKVFDQNSKKKNEQTGFSCVEFVFLQTIDTTKEKDASNDSLLMSGQTNNQSNLQAYSSKFLKENEQSISLEYIPSACVLIKSRGARSFEAMGFVIFQLDHSERWVKNRNCKTIAAGPTRFILLILKSLVQICNSKRKKNWIRKCLRWMNQGAKKDSKTRAAVSLDCLNDQEKKMKGK
jgi:hypothetical protein